jgi:DNA-binding NarL/FixJ family response regulator
LIADDHTVLRHGLRLILNEAADMAVIGEAASGDEAVSMTLELQPNVVLMDVGMPGLDGIEATRRIRATRPDVAVLILTISDRDRDLIEAIKAGARGYLLKSTGSGDVIEGVRRVAAGEAVVPPPLMARVFDELARPASDARSLTDRELEILSLVARGLGNKDIATRLVISENTVKTHVRHILEKSNLSNRAEAAAYAVQIGLTQKD